MATYMKPDRKDDFEDESINYYLAPGDVLVQCPYGSHKILKQKLIVHLSKCSTAYEKKRARNPNLPAYKICPAVYTHHVKASEYNDHLKTCIDNIQLDKETESFKKFKEEQKWLENIPAETKNKAVATFTDDNLTYTEKSLTAFDESLMTTLDMNESASIFTCTTSAPFDETEMNPNSSRIRFQQKEIEPKRFELKDEDWDEDLKLATTTGEGRPGYFPDIVRASQNILFVPPGMSKKERSEYREKIRTLPKPKVMEIGGGDLDKARAEEMEWSDFKYGMAPYMHGIGRSEQEESRRVQLLPRAFHGAQPMHQWPTPRQKIVKVNTGPEVIQWRNRMRAQLTPRNEYYCFRKQRN